MLLLIIHLFSILLQVDPTITDFIGQFSLLGIPCIVLIPFIVEALKAANWLPSGWGGITAIIVSFIVFGAAAIVNFFPSSAGVIGYILGAALAGLGSVGAYSLVSTAWNKAHEQPNSGN